MTSIIFSLVPVFAVIALGHVLRRVTLLPPEGWTALDRVNYFVLFPALILHTLITADIRALVIGPLAAALLSTIAVLVLLLLAARRLMPMRGPQYSSVFQGTLRWNGFVAIAALGSLYGAPGVALAAIAIAVLVPTLNVLSVWVLTRNSGATPPSLIRTIYILVGNPLILACAVGIAWQGLTLSAPGPFAATLQLLGNGALVLGLMSVGAALDLKASHATRRLVVLATVAKLVLAPLLMALWCWAFGVEGLARSVAILVGAVPTATSSYILARQLGGDAVLMANLVTATTVGALVTMPLTAYLLA